MDRMLGSNSTAKGIKQQRKRVTEEKADRISSLPDAVIQDILSYLDMKDAVSTSVLAKRWRYLWTFTPHINLDDRLHRVGFARFVDKLHRLYNAPKITAYKLVTRRPINSILAQSWVKFAVEHNVEQLHMDMVGGAPFEMTSCDSVRKMKLTLGDGDLLLRVPERFSMLETMLLSNVRVSGNAFLHLNSDFCPLLKNLSMEKCIDLVHLKVVCPNLEYLYINNCSQLDQLVICGPKLETLSVGECFRDGSPTSLLKISAPNLRVFRWLDFFIENSSLGEFECLRLARVSLVSGYDEEVRGPYSKNAKKFLLHLASAQTLEVEIPCFAGLSINLDLLEELSSSLSNLKKLSLLVGPEDKYIFRGISFLFQCFRNLERLSIHTVLEDTEEEPSYRFPKIPALHLTGPLNKLLEVDFCGIAGKWYEMEFLKYLLGNAVILKKMFIVLSPDYITSERRRSSVVQKVINFRRSSSEAVISFQNRCS